MGLNLDNLRKKLEDLQSKNEGKSFERDPRLWAPKPGLNRIRIIPLKDTPQDPFLKLNMHYAVCPGGKLSLKNFNEQDPIVDFAVQQIKAGNELTFNKTNPQPEEGKKMYFLGTEILGGKQNAAQEQAIPRYNCIMVDRENEKELKWWTHSEGIFTEIVKAALTLQKNLLDFNVIKPGEDVDFTDPEKGYDLEVTYTPSEKNKEQTMKKYPNYKGPWSTKTFGETNVKFENKSSVLTTDKDLAYEILHNQIDIYDIYRKPTFEELQRDLDIYLNKKEKEDNRKTDKKEEIKYNAPATTSTQSETKVEQKVEAPKEEPKNTDAVSAATDKFKELFG